MSSSIDYTSSNINYASEVNSNLSSNKNKFGEALKGASNALGSVEDDLITAFTLKPGSGTSAKAKELAGDYGMLDANGNFNGSVEALQTIVKTKYEAAMRSISMLSNILSNANAVMLQIINKIGR